MESSDGLVEEVSKLRNGMCKAPVVTDDGLVWRVTMVEGNPVDRSSGKGLLRMGHVNKTCINYPDSYHNLSFQYCNSIS